MFDFKFFGNVKFGSGSRFQLKKIIQNDGYQSIVVVIDGNIRSLKIFDDLINEIADFIVAEIESDISEPTYEKLEEKRKEINSKKVDLFVGIGGGSALDMAKGLAVLYSNSGPAISYRGFEQYMEPITPIIALPTTAGTGSEITPNASFIDTKEKKKMGINGEAIRPKYALLDPELTITCPIFPTISAGVDSLVHATEAFVAKKSNPMVRIFAKEGFNLVFENLPKLSKDLTNLDGMLYIAQ